MHRDTDELILRMFNYIALKLNRIEQEIFNMSQELDTLQAAVAASDQVIDSALTLITGLAAQLDAAIAAAAAASAAGAADLSALTALSADINAKAAALAAAVAANTPAAPAV